MVSEEKPVKIIIAFQWFLPKLDTVFALRSSVIKLQAIRIFRLSFPEAFCVYLQKHSVVRVLSQRRRFTVVFNNETIG